MLGLARRVKRKKKDVSYSTFIYKILKKGHPALGISNRGMAIMNGVVRYTLHIMLNELRTLDQFNSGPVTARDVQTAVKLNFPLELAKRIIVEGTKAVTRYQAGSNTPPSGYNEHAEKIVGTADENSDDDSEKQLPGLGVALSRSQKAGVVFPVGRIHGLVKEQFGKGNSVGATGAVYIAALLDYMVAQVLEGAAKATQENSTVSITPRHIMFAIRQDEELDRLFAKCVIAGAGVVPYLHPALLRKQFADPTGEEQQIDESC